MNLFQKTKDVVQMGFGVKLSSEALHLHIEVSFRDETKTQVLPLHDHFTEDRLVGCIDLMVNKFHQELMDKNKKK